jgi:hypothetical protein
VPDWSIQIFIAAFGVAVTAGVVQAKVGALSKSYDQIAASIHALSIQVATLSTADAVNAAQFAALSRRVSDAEQKLGQHDERITVLRTKAHMLSNKLMEVDPNWKPYQRMDD